MRRNAIAIVNIVRVIATAHITFVIASAPDKMPIEIKKEIELEIAYVLFIDIVGYSKLVTHEQRRLLELLNRIVREAEHFRMAEANGRLITVPDNGLAQYYTEEASGLFRARISRPVSNGTVTVTPLVSRGRPDRPDRTKVV